jgi:YgiT-type zinc finger domain-containing protein
MGKSQKTKGLSIMQNQCNVCGGTTFEERTITNIFETPMGEKVIIDHIPATVCATCGETSFSFDTTQHISELVHAVAQKTLAASRAMPVYEYA